jgi:hypothetical protein
MDGMVVPALTPLSPWQLLQVRARISMFPTAMAVPARQNRPQAKIPLNIVSVSSGFFQGKQMRTAVRLTQLHYRTTPFNIVSSTRRPEYHTSHRLLDHYQSRKQQALEVAAAI